MPIPPKAPIQLEGYKEFQRNLRRQQNKELPKAIGAAHKEVGRFVISKLEPAPKPAAVGAGSGASVRPSATKRDVIIRAGGKHRAVKAAERGVSVAAIQWGKKSVYSANPPARPHIIGTARDHEQEIRQELLDQIIKAMGPAFAEAK